MLLKTRLSAAAGTWRVTHDGLDLAAQHRVCQADSTRESVQYITTCSLANKKDNCIPSPDKICICFLLALVQFCTLSLKASAVPAAHTVSGPSSTLANQRFIGSIRIRLLAP